MRKDKELNRHRMDRLRHILSLLHEGKSVEEVQGIFMETFGTVSAEEISRAEQALINEGMPVSEIQRLCDVHAAVFKGSIEEIHEPSDLSLIPGHPAHTLKAENRALEAEMAFIEAQLLLMPDAQALEDLREGMARLSRIDVHYRKKEDLLFPYMEKYGVTAPPKVMWGVDDEIRKEIEHARANLKSKDLQDVEDVLERVRDMIFKEEHILLPILMEKLTREDWAQVARDTDEFGYCLIDEPVVKWPRAEQEKDGSRPVIQAGDISLSTGAFTERELEALLNTLPVDITFVDAKDRVRYFSRGSERIFPRTVTVLRRSVSNCHPPASVHIVEKIVDDLRTGRKDREDFWIRMGDKLIYISYAAVRSPEGEYLGVLETTQNIKPMQELTGEKRLMSD